MLAHCVLSLQQIQSILGYLYTFHYSNLNTSHINIQNHNRLFYICLITCERQSDMYCERSGPFIDLFTWCIWQCIMKFYILIVMSAASSRQLWQNFSQSTAKTVKANNMCETHSKRVWMENREKKRFLSLCNLHIQLFCMIYGVEWNECVYVGGRRVMGGRKKVRHERVRESNLKFAKSIKFMLIIQKLRKSLFPQNHSNPHILCSPPPPLTLRARNRFCGISILRNYRVSFEWLIDIR